MKQDLIKDIIQGMLPYLNNAQNEKLQEVLKYTLANYEVTENQSKENYSEQNYVELFLSAKRIEGCSEKSLKYYKATIEAMGSGTTFKEVSGNTMKNIVVNVPTDKKVQEKIAAILGSIDDKIEENEQINNNLAA